MSPYHFSYTTVNKGATGSSWLALDTVLSTKLKMDIPIKTKQIIRENKI